MLIYRNRPFFLVLTLFLVLVSTLNVSARRQDLFQTKYDLDKRIQDERLTAATADNSHQKRAIRRLFRLHQKRVRIDQADEEAAWAFIQDDLQFGEGRFAVHLLTHMHTNAAKIKLMELNREATRLDQTIHTKPFTNNFFSRLVQKFSGKTRYTFTEDNLSSIILTLNHDTLTQEEMTLLAKMDERTLAEPSLAEEPPAEIPPTEPVSTIPEPAIKEIPSESLTEEMAPTQAIKPVSQDLVEPGITSTEIQIKTPSPPVATEVIPVSPPVTTRTKPAPLPGYFWQLVKVTQDVEMRTGDEGSWQKATNGAKVYEGSHIRTGDNSSVLLLIKGVDNDDSYSQLFANTELKVIKLASNNLDELDEVYLDLVLGEVLVNVEGLSDQSTFQVKTPTAIAGVRGTTFGIQVLANQVARILVMNGTVGVTPTTITAFAQEILVRQGHEIKAEQGIPFQPPFLSDDATQEQYQQMAEQIAAEIQESIANQNPQNFGEEGGEEEPGEGFEEGDDELIDGPDNGEEGPNVDPETGQLLDPDGNLVFGENGEPLFFVDGQVVDSQGNPVEHFGPDGGPGAGDDGPVYLIDPETGEPIRDENGNFIVLDPNGNEQDHDIHFDDTGGGQQEEEIFPKPIPIDPCPDPTNPLCPENNDDAYFEALIGLGIPPEEAAAIIEGGLEGGDPFFDEDGFGEDGEYFPPEDLPFDPDDPFLPPEFIDDEFPVAIMDLISETDDGTNLIFEVTGAPSFDPGNEGEPNNGIVKYEWDFWPFDGIIDHVGKEYIIIVPANTPEEELDVKLTVFDADGNSSFTTAKSEDPFAGAADIVLDVSNDPAVGSDTDGDGSFEKPFRTIQKAMTEAYTFDPGVSIALILRYDSGSPDFTLPAGGLDMRPNTNIESDKQGAIAVIDCQNDTGIIVNGGTADFSDLIIINGDPAFDFTDTDAIFFNVEIKSGNQAITSTTSDNGNQIDLIECDINTNNSGTQPVLEFVGNGVRIQSSLIQNNSTSTGGNIIDSGASPCIIENSLITGNSTVGDPIVWHGGGSAGGLHIIQSTLHNAATSVEVTNDVLLEFKNSTFTGSTGLPVVDASTVSLGNADIDNCFFADASPATTDMVVDLGGSSYDTDGSAADINNPAGFTANLGGVPPIYKGDFTPDANGGSPLVDVGSNSFFSHSFDVYQNPRFQDGGVAAGVVDIGAAEAQSSADPLVFGRLYDSLTGESVRDAVVAIYRENGRSPQETIQTGGNGNFRFNVLPGKFFLIVNKEGTHFPSSRTQSAVPGDHGGLFEVLDGIDKEINIPLDTRAQLRINKTANKSRVTPGELVTFNVSIVNPYWFATVENFNLMDTLPPGFKYISRSIRKNGVAWPEPVKNGKILDIAIPRLAARQTTHISYQMVPSTGLANGTYLSTAVIHDGSTGNTISNESGVKIEIIPDPLFTNGTLIGRVFQDENGNGFYDPGEQGLKEVTLATEYGALITTDAFGLYHLKNIPTGRHTIQADPNTLDEGWVSHYKHGVPFEIFEGSMAKANIPVVPESIDNPRRPFFFVSLGEVTVSQNDISGNMSLVEANDDFDEDLNVDGRGAFFLRGKIQGKYLVTASYDSARLSRDNRYLRYNKLFTNLNPNDYYPIYGDGSRVDYSASETSDALYVMVEWDESFARWGSMEVDWIAYRRVMQGGHAVLKSAEKTEYGQTRREAEGFYATSDSQSVQEQFIGTGTSVYHLEHTPIIEGSEKVRVQFKNRYSLTPLHERILVEEVDYAIDYAKGRIILTRPLTSTLLQYNQTIISNDILAGAQGVLVVDYEYESRSALDRAAFGGRVKNAFGDHVIVEAGYAEEDRDKNPYKLLTTTTTFQVNEQTSVIATYNESEESFAGGGLSYDSGLTMGSQTANLKENQKGSSWSVSGNTLVLDERLELATSYSEQEAGYSALASFSSSNTEKLTADAVWHFNETLSTGVSLQNDDTKSNTSTTQAVAVVSHQYKTNLFLDWNTKNWDGRLEYIHQDIGLPFQGVRYLGALPPRGRQLMAARFGWKPLEGHHYYVIGQGTLEQENMEDLDNDMFTLGAKIPVLDRIDLQLEGRAGTIGESALGNLIINEEGDAQSHLGFETGTHDNQGQYQSVSFAKTYLSDDGTTYRFVKDYSYYDNRVLQGDLMGADIPLNPNWSIGVSYEVSHVDEKETVNAVSREVATFRYNFLEPDFIKLFGKVEWREDHEHEEDIKTEHIYISDDLIYQVTDDLSLKLKGAVGYAKADNDKMRTFDFTEGSLGFAWRPKQNDRLNLLGRYTYIDDLPLENRTRFIEETEQRKRITSLDGIYDLTDYLQVVEKVAYRTLSEKTGPRNWVDSDTWLWINGLNIQFLESWALGGEFRILENETFDDRKTGYLLQVSRDMGDMVRLTLGYNFTDFDDNLANRDEYDRKGGFFRVEGRY